MKSKPFQQTKPNIPQSRYLEYFIIKWWSWWKVSRFPETWKEHRLRRY